MIKNSLGYYFKVVSTLTLVARRSSSVGDDLVNFVCARLISFSLTDKGETLISANL